jgi:hypothetical protein
MPPRTFALLALLALLGLASAVKPSVLEMEDDPDCPEPKLGGRDIHGHKGAAPARFAASAFSLEGGAAVPAAPPRPAVRAMLRAPVHTCRIKQSPGLREWIKTKGALFGDELVAVQAYSQPPSMLFVDADGSVFEHVEISEAATVADITGLLRSRGITSSEDGEGAPGEGLDLGAAARAADAFQPERDMEIAMALRAAQAELAAARAEMAAARAAAEGKALASAESRAAASELELERLHAELAAMEVAAGGEVAPVAAPTAAAAAAAGKKTAAAAAQKTAAAAVGARSGEADMLEL